MKYLLSLSNKLRSLCKTFGGCRVGRSFGEQNQAIGIQSKGDNSTTRSKQQVKMMIKT